MLPFNILVYCKTSPSEAAMGGRRVWFTVILSLYNVCSHWELLQMADQPPSPRHGHMLPRLGSGTAALRKWLLLPVSVADLRASPDAFHLPVPLPSPAPLATGGNVSWQCLFSYVSILNVPCSRVVRKYHRSPCVFASPPCNSRAPPVGEMRYYFPSSLAPAARCCDSS